MAFGERFKEKEKGGTRGLTTYYLEGFTENSLRMGSKGKRKRRTKGRRGRGGEGVERKGKEGGGKVSM